ncbi:MAG: bifunctional UDP-N-acetylglucosamine diphosphorylase/glucosamine-1-phosphate N-acetyltransferase GlmU [Holosporales bacterium]|jgi:bifunctional UDP-N-acetylglucosamine pyrophosphorylase/glucosamine-1-phosphate N-acetyltransferase|nr:bifunctional UDP-N-acetylglucosamine diphosphorylase/glucosamine-1-phosphate N-acetyltransferase GlmU [Holosporales bacterium]
MLGKIPKSEIFEKVSSANETLKSNDVDFVILAGGLGTRTHTNCPKMFLEIAGQALIRYIINLCAIFSDRIISVVSPQLIGHHLFDGSVQAIQEKPKGTGDAIKSAIPFIDSENIVIMCSDTPLIESKHINALLATDGDVAIIACRIPDDMLDMPYGRIIFDEHQQFVKIVEHSDINYKEKDYPYANCGIYRIKTNILKKYIPYLSQDHLSGEYYITDLLSILNENDVKISVIMSDEYWPFHGINTLNDLALAENIIQKKLRSKFMKNGVKLSDPESVYFSFDSEIGSDVTIEQDVVIKNGVTIRSGSTIKSFCYLENCVIMENAVIGPFARIRDQSVMMENAIIGNFVEIKQSTIGRSAKVKHLSYIGNTYVGYKSNIGAGTITCNYDGVKKHKSVIGDNVMVGSNCSIISPIKIGDEALVAAGSVITEDVPGNTLAIARPKQQNLINKASEILNRKRRLNRNAT